MSEKVPQSEGEVVAAYLGESKGDEGKASEPMFHLHIDCVDGETVYSHSSKDKTSLLKFLERYDHEGSSITLVIDKGPHAEGERRRTVHDERAYRTLT